MGTSAPLELSAGYGVVVTEGPKTLDQAIGRVIARRRGEKAMTQEALAEVLGTSTGRVRNFEQGRQAVPIAFMWEVAGLFKCSVTDLVTDAEELLRAQGITPPEPNPNTVLRSISRSLGF